MFNSTSEIVEWLKANENHVIHDHLDYAYVWIPKYDKIGCFSHTKDALDGKYNNYQYILKAYREEEFNLLFDPGDLHLGHQLYLVKLPDRSFKYDFDKYSTFEDAIVGQWKGKLPHSRERLEELMKICYPWDSWRPERWQEFVDKFFQDNL